MNRNYEFPLPTWENWSVIPCSILFNFRPIPAKSSCTIRGVNVAAESYERSTRIDGSVYVAAHPVAENAYKIVVRIKNVTPDELCGSDHPRVCTPAISGLRPSW